MKHSEYFQYLETHRANVRRAWNELMKPILLGWGQDSSQIEYIDTLIADHDISKFTPKEFGPYDDMYAGREGRHEEEIDIAWLHHQNSNMHHWQYWVVIADSSHDGIHPVDMPFEYICEMLCDWASFQYVEPGNTAHKWYIKNKQHMILSPRTKSVVEELLKLCPDL